MKEGSFECHITLEPESRLVVESIAKKHKFKVSALVGDEVMGDDKLLYCTTHDSDFKRIMDRMEDLISELPEPVKVLRKKIELILLDQRFT
jgi:hypothetical protein